MLYQALKLVKEEINTYLNFHLETSPTVEVAILDNIAMIHQDDSNLQDHVVISLVNIEEERSLKNARIVRKDSLTGQSTYEHPSVHLNLYLLFSAYYVSATGGGYEKAINALNYVIEFFQHRPNFSFTSSPNTPVSSNLDDFPTNQIKMQFNIYTMTTEQLNHLWGSLGGQQLPSVLYRVALVEIRDQQQADGGQLIEEIQSQELKV